MIGFDFVVRWCETDRVEGPFFDVFVAWDVVPAFEFFFAAERDPVEPEDAFLVAVDTAVDRVGTGSFFDSFVVDFNLELLCPFFWSKRGVAEGLCDFSGDGMEHGSLEKTSRTI